MPRYDTYFLMKEADVIDYVQTKYPGHFDKDAVLTVKEIGDGNLNYVFRVVEEKTGKSIIVKQAGEALRISADMKVSTDRNRIESEILQIQDKYAPGLVPKIYGYDTVMCACAMEDLSDHALMRYALMRHETFPRFAEDISTYMVNTLLKTTDVAMEHKEKKAMVKSFINPELCEITEDLVLTEPYNDCNHRNNVFPPIADFVRRELYEDDALKLAVAKLKFEFMNNAQSLIHGDLHTGSIFVKQDSTRVFDPEFAFYGPMGYDIGNVVANLIFAWDNGRAAGADEFCDWALKAIEETVDLFCQKFLKCFDECVTDLMAKTANGRLSQMDKVSFETYVQAHYFDRVLEAANRRLRVMTNGRYELARGTEARSKTSQSGLDIDVADAYTGKSRDAGTLSGGEAFKASLALALGLSDVVQAHAGGIQLDAMFIDEGFGSLDQESLQLAVKTLTELTGGGKLVGIISHVDDLKESIDRKIVVERGMTGSTLRMEA